MKDHTSFFAVSTKLIVSFFSRCLESVSDFFSLLIDCSGSLSLFLRGGAIQRGDRDQMRPKGQVSRGGGGGGLVV